MHGRNKLFCPVLHTISAKTIFGQKLFSREIQLSEADRQRSNVYYTDDAEEYKQYWLQVWWQGILLARGPPNARKIVIFTFSIEHPFFWPNSKANKTILYLYINIYMLFLSIIPTHTRALTRHEVIIMSKSHPSPMGSGRHGKLFESQYWLYTRWAVELSVPSTIVHCSTCIREYDSVYAV